MDSEQGVKIEIENVGFLELFDIESIQKLQDVFSAATGVASIITNTDGVPITRPSNFCRLCDEIIRKTEVGLKKCYHSDALLGRTNANGAIYQKCLSAGLWDGGASISVGSKHIANWLIGQVRNEETSEEKLLQYAKEISVDEEVYKNALKEVTTMSLERFQKICDALFLIANQLSQQAYQNFQLKIYQNRLEMLVKEKTESLETINEELYTANEELYEKNKIIKEQNNELVTALDNLKSAQAQLLQAEKMASIGVLTAGVAHEINNPLNYIMGAYVGLDNYFNKNLPKQKEQVSLLLNGLKLGIDRVSSIVQGLSQFSRINNVMEEACEIHSILENCLAILYNQYKYHIRIEKSYERSSIIVKGNVGKLHQVFINILINSIQAISGNGFISIATKLNTKNVEVLISDSGCGIAQENMPKIFDPFYTTKPPGKGTGLGLYLTYNIVQEHNGRIEFESEINVGTKVKIVLPLD